MEPFAEAEGQVAGLLDGPFAGGVRGDAARCIRRAVAGSAGLTYGELNAQANRLARYLVSLGAGPERLVAIAMPRSADVVVAMLAVLTSGAAYVPVDPEFPADRIAFMLADTAAPVVITTSALAGALPGEAAPLVLDGPATQETIAGYPPGTCPQLSAANRCDRVIRRM